MQKRVQFCFICVFNSKISKVYILNLCHKVRYRSIILNVALKLRVTKMTPKIYTDWQNFRSIVVLHMYYIELSGNIGLVGWLKGPPQKSENISCIKNWHFFAALLLRSTLNGREPQEVPISWVSCWIAYYRSEHHYRLAYFLIDPLCIHLIGHLSRSSSIHVQFSGRFFFLSSRKIIIKGIRILPIKRLLSVYSTVDRISIFKNRPNIRIISKNVVLLHCIK